MFDLGPATTTMSGLVRAVRDDQLDGATPCSDWTVGGLLAHIHQFTSVFTTSAHKLAPNPPTSLVDDWREAIPRDLDALAVAWREDSAWHGQVSAGGVDMAAADNAVVGIEELTVHGWDLARATGQDFRVGDDQLDRVDPFFSLFGDTPFGDRVELSDDASRLDRLLARTGRDPQWTATR